MHAVGAVLMVVGEEVGGGGGGEGRCLRCVYHYR